MLDPEVPTTSTFAFTGLADDVSGPAPWTASTAVLGTATVQSEAVADDWRPPGVGRGRTRPASTTPLHPHDVEILFTMSVGGTERIPHL